MSQILAFTLASPSPATRQPSLRSRGSSHGALVAKIPGHRRIILFKSPVELVTANVWLTYRGVVDDADQYSAVTFIVTRANGALPSGQFRGDFTANLVLVTEENFPALPMSNAVLIHSMRLNPTCECNEEIAALVMEWSRPATLSELTTH